ncbi:hypothetical protein Tco_1212366 [Tanacetum coccineum]
MDIERQSIKLIPYVLQSDKVLKINNIKKDGYTRFQHQEQYEYVGPEVTRSQEGKRSQDDDKRLCLVDDLKEVLENMNVNIAWEKEEVHVVDVEMDEDHEGEITKIKEALQWSLDEYPFLVFMELKD